MLRRSAIYTSSSSTRGIRLAYMHLRIPSPNAAALSRIAMNNGPYTCASSSTRSTSSVPVPQLHAQQLLSASWQWHARACMDLHMYMHRHVRLLSSSTKTESNDSRVLTAPHLSTLMRRLYLKVHPV
jgi:hypothetical protein